MLNLLTKRQGGGLLSSYKLTAIATIAVSVINIYYWLVGDLFNIFTGYTINPVATMKAITSVGFLILVANYYLKNKRVIEILIFTGLLVQYTQFSLIYFEIVDPEDCYLSSPITIFMFSLAYLAFYFIKVRSKKILFLIFNGILYLLSAFAVFYYLLDMQELNTISGFETLSWNTAMLFFMNSISLFELKLIKHIDSMKLQEIISRKTHPYNYFPFFFLVPILLILFVSVLAYYKIITIVQATFLIFLFLNTSSFINMFFYSYNFILFYLNVTEKASELKVINRKLNNLNTELAKLNKQLKQKNTYLEDFATITSHNLREPIIALSELQKISEQITTEDSFEDYDIKSMYKASIDRLKQGINSLVQYHKFIKNEDMIAQESISLKKGIEDVYTDLKLSIPKDTVINFNFKDDILLPKNYIDTIFKNLLTNSFKFKKESIPLNINITAYKINGNYTIFYKDNGIGINLGLFKNQLFNKRSRFHKKSNNSNGYGLFYTKLCVEKLKGKIDVYSTLGKGTGFKIKLNYPE